MPTASLSFAYSHSYTAIPLADPSLVVMVSLLRCRHLLGLALVLSTALVRVPFRLGVTSYPIRAYPFFLSS